MKPLKIERMGDVVQGVTLRGDPKVCPEPEHFRVVLPFGDVDIARCSDGSYWVHVRVASEADTHGADEKEGKLIDARIDVRGKHASDSSAGDFAHPDAYHVAVRVGPK